MACFTLRDKDGNERKVGENVNYVKVNGEEIVPGLIDWTCNGHYLQDYTNVFTKEGFMVGNAIKKVTNAIGMKQCLACKGRQRHYNEVGIRLQEKVKEVIKKVIK